VIFQPKHQLQTFKDWAGNGSSDISYYLNSHHVDFHEWVVGDTSRPVSVTAVAATGVATRELGNQLDTILHNLHVNI
jgi:D-galacturonate reductase